MAKLKSTQIYGDLDVTGNIRGNHVGNSETATKLQTARTINGTSFNGSANITTSKWGTARTLSLTGGVTGSASIDGSGNVSLSTTIAGTAPTATKLATARTINGTTFDGSGNITTANWGTSRTITIGNTGKSVNGSGNVSWTLSEIGAAAASHTHTSSQISDATNANTANKIVKRDSSGNFSAGTITATLSGNASTATKLKTARTINGTNFDGSANITTANWGTARNIQIGNTAKSVNGSANVTWSLSEIGAAASSHTHTSFTNVTKVDFKATPTDIASIKTTLFTDNNKEITNLDFCLGDNPAQYGPTDEGYATCDRFRWRFKPINTSNYSEFSIMEAFAKEIGNRLKGELLINGDLYCTDGKNSVSLGVGTDSKDVYMYNQKANKFLQICDDGTLRYSGLKLYHEGNRPYPLDIGALPVSGGTMTGDLNITPGFYLKSWRPDGININLIGISQHGVVDVGSANSSIALLSHDLPKHWDGSNQYDIITGKGGRLDNGVNFGGQSTLIHANNGIMLYDKNYDRNMSILFQNGLINFYSTTGGFRINQTVRIEGNLYPHSPGHHWIGDDGSPFWGMRTTGGGFSQVSDRTYKEDIRDIDDSVFFDMIKNTKVHSYLYKEPTSSDVQTLNIKPQRTQESVDKDLLNIGILAQELAENEGSEYILNKGESGIYSLNLYNFSSAIMSALRHEISKREELEDYVKSLEKRLELLEK